MIDLSIFFKVHFDTYRISDEKLKRFAQDHVQRLSANNPGGKFNAILAAATAAYEAYSTAINNESISQALQEAGTVETDQLMREFIDLVTLKEGIIRGTWGKDSPVYQEFYPRGSQEYHNANKANIEELMTRYNQAIENHKEDLPANFGLPISTVITNYLNVRTTQLHRIGTTDGNKLTTALKRKDLEKQLMRNLLFIAYENVGIMGAVSVYFEQSIIKPRLSAAGNELIEGQPGPETKFVMLDGEFTPETRFAIENNGTVPLKFYTAMSVEDEIPATALELNPGGKIEVTSPMLGNPGNTMMICYNPSPDTSGSFISEVKEKVK